MCTIQTYWSQPDARLLIRQIVNIIKEYYLTILGYISVVIPYEETVPFPFQCYLSRKLYLAILGTII